MHSFSTLYFIFVMFYIFLFIWSSFTQVRIFSVRSFSKLMFHVPQKIGIAIKKLHSDCSSAHVREYSSGKVLFILFYKLWFISFKVSGLCLPLEANLFWLMLRVFLEDKSDIPGQRWNPKASEVMFVSQGLC